MYVYEANSVEKSEIMKIFNSNEGSKKQNKYRRKKSTIDNINRKQ